MTILNRLLAALLAMLVAVPAAAADFAVARADVTFTDSSRPIKASSGFAGSADRRLDVIVWHPEGAGKGPWPLVVYSHGTFGRPDEATHLVRALVARGYVVAAAAYPLTSSAAFTRIRFADISDAGQQVRDVRFIIDSLLAHPVYGPMIDAQRIGVTGHSLGGVTSYFATYGRQVRDPRIRALAAIGAADPVQTALENDMGLWGTSHAPVPVPALFLSAEKDVFARFTGRPHAAFSRVERPKHEVMIRGGVHVWFKDGDERPAGNRNPDCLFFDRWMPGVAIPGCDERVPLVGPARQQAIARAAVTAFFDAYLKDDRQALGRLHALARDKAVDYRSEE